MTDGTFKHDDFFNEQELLDLQHDEHSSQERKNFINFLIKNKSIILYVSGFIDCLVLLTLLKFFGIL